MELFTKLFQNKNDHSPMEMRIACFREVLQANNAALGFIAEIQEALELKGFLTASNVTRMVAGVTVQTFRMITNLVQMTDSRKHKELMPIFNKLKKEITGALGPMPLLKKCGFVVPLSEVGPELAEVVGTKNAFLGEARCILQGHIPDGFATTVEAFQAFMNAEGLGNRIASEMESLAGRDIAACFEKSARIVQMIETCRVPEDVADAIKAATAGIAGNSETRFAVRSSALQEDGPEVSFAGQYRSMLNIPQDDVVEAFRRVIASKYSPQAIVYRMERGFSDAEVAMCCCVIKMVEASAAGVMYTRYPSRYGQKSILQAVRGLGLSAVDGSTEPDSFILDPSSHKVLEEKLGWQDALLRSAPLEGTDKVPVDDEKRLRLAITSQQALRIAELAWRIETAFNKALDIEWAIDSDGCPFILQVRPLAHIPGGFGKTEKSRIEGESILIDRGTRASRGAGAGPVCHIESDLDILRCPSRCVIATRDANPRLAVLLPRAVAVVADRGDITGHLATVARELRVPALFAARDATKILKPGEMVTVDADARVVYAGRVGAALEAQLPSAPALRNPNRELLQSISELIIQLTLKDRYASGYAPQKCKTIHDIIRFCHQATIEAMFDLGDKQLRRGQSLRKLVSQVPIDCRVFDLGGGLATRNDDEEIVLEDVACRPMQHLWRGMTDPRMNWRQLKPVSLRGFMSAVMNYNFDQDSRMRPMGEPSYAFVTAEYLNLNSRIGYHFSTVDAHICNKIESNYVSFRFVGGSTGIEQRSRRATLLQRLLTESGFETDCRADLINARMRYRPAAEMDGALFQIGLLMGYVNHLDMALVSDEVMNQYVDAFWAGNYGFKGSEDWR
jgi:pyruvate,water dikinase